MKIKLDLAQRRRASELVSWIIDNPDEAAHELIGLRDAVAEQEGERERFVRDRVTTVLAVLSGAPMDNLTEDLQGIVKHWQKNISHRIQQQAANPSSRDTEGESSRPPRGGQHHD